MADTIFISAGEASGEAYGAQLIESAKRLAPLSFFGLGGPKMREAGCDIVVESHDVAVVGLAEVVRHLPRIYARYRALLREIDRRKPKAAVLIDFPDFNFRLAKQLHKRGISVVYFVSPQLWAWRQSRLELVKKYVAKMLVIFPFEEQWYRERGVQAEYVGHPLAEFQPQINADHADSRRAYAERWGLDPAKQWIALLPGSRKGEVTRHAAVLHRAASILRRDGRTEFIVPVPKTLDATWVKFQLDSHLDRNLDPPREIEPPKFVVVDHARDALSHSRVAVVASGTATVEAALVGTPFVVIYRLLGMTWTLGRRFVDLKHFAMPNLIAGREVVPELIQDGLTAENVVAELRKLIVESAERARMIEGLAEVRAKLEPTGVPAARRAAQILVEVAGSGK